jgi:hypothetical protein
VATVKNLCDQGKWPLDIPVPDTAQWVWQGCHWFCPLWGFNSPIFFVIVQSWKKMPKLPSS